MSYRHYSSEFLHQINLKCKPKLSKKQSISISKILNFEKIKRNKSLTKNSTSFPNFSSSILLKSKKEQKLNKDCFSKKVGSPNLSPSSPKHFMSPRATKNQSLGLEKNENGNLSQNNHAGGGAWSQNTEKLNSDILHPTLLCLIQVGPRYIFLPIFSLGPTYFLPPYLYDFF